MQTRTKLIGAAAACAACCAVPILAAILAGGGIAALGGAAFAGKEAVAVVLVLATVGLVVFWRKRSTSQKAASECGCGGTCAEGSIPSASCTLPAK